MAGYSLRDPARRAVLERRIRDQRVSAALAGYCLRLPAGSAAGITWGHELTRLPPEAAVRQLMGRWGPGGWTTCFIYEADGTLVWQARLRGKMAPGDYLTAADPLDLHEQIGLYPVRQVSVPL